MSSHDHTCHEPAVDEEVEVAIPVGVGHVLPKAAVGVVVQDAIALDTNVDAVEKAAEDVEDVDDEVEEVVGAVVEEAVALGSMAIVTKKTPSLV